VPEKLLLIDGHNLFHRAFHALPPLSTSDGQPTNAIYGFVQMVLSLLEQEEPDYAVVAVDLPGPTFRAEMYSDYKAHRPPMDEALVAQISLLDESIGALGLRRVGLPGFEADDVMGTLAKVASNAGTEVVVVSGDRDMLQLVRPGVTVIASMSGIKDTKQYDEAAVTEEFGITPAQIVDLKALSGDKSDNIPGVPGIGDKGAKVILEQAGSLEEALAIVEELKPPRMGKLLAEGRDVARLSHELATIRIDAPIEVSLEDCRWSGPAYDALRALATELEFTKLLVRLPGAAGSTPTIEAQVVANEAQMAEVAAAIVKAGSVCMAVGGDTLALAVDEDTVWELQLGNGEDTEGTLFDDPVESAPSLGPIAEVLADEAIAKRGADLKSTIRHLAGFGVQVRGAEFDPEIASYLLTPNRRDHSISLLANERLGIALPEATGEDGSDQSATRAAAEAVAVAQVREPMLTAMQEAGVAELFSGMEMPLVEVLAAMESVGIALDVDKLAGLGEELDALLADLQAEVYELAGREFNIGSPKQLGEVLFDDLGLPKGRRTKTGWSTNAAVLDELADESEVVSKVLQWREYAKLKSTYVDGLARELNRETGRVHTTFEQTVAATGRLSSRNPNLQNIPIRTEWGRRIRSCFVVGDEANVLLAADYSQIELRILAHISGDPQLVEAFRAGEDIHTRTASAIFDVTPGEVTKQMRSRAKTVNFAVLYGQGSGALAKQLGINRKEASQFIANYFERLGGVREYIDGITATARDQLFVKTLLDRKRPIADINSPNGQTRAYAERTAVNTPIQGTAADIIKVAMNRLAPVLAEASPASAVLLQVHDELVLEVPEDEIEKVGRLVKEVMEGALELDVPLTVDVAAGKNWRDMESLDQILQ